MKHRAENNRRLEVLYNESDGWLKAVAFNLTKNKESAEELVAELYLYLAEKCNPALWYLKSFNLMYCHSFIKSRFLNRIKVDKRSTSLSDSWDTTDEEYNVEGDEKFERAWDEVLGELKRLERTRMWAPAKIYQLYAFDEGMTLEKLANNIQISKSTAFLNCKKVKLHLRANIESPFKNDRD